MNIEAVKEVQARLIEKGALHNLSKVIVTHFSHNAGLTHDELEKLLLPSGIEVAFDGLEITI